MGFLDDMFSGAAQFAADVGNTVGEVASNANDIATSIGDNIMSAAEAAGDAIAAPIKNIGGGLATVAVLALIGILVFKAL